MNHVCHRLNHKDSENSKRSYLLRTSDTKTMTRKDIVVVKGMVPGMDYCLRMCHEPHDRIEVVEHRKH